MNKKQTTWHDAMKEKGHIPKMDNWDSGSELDIFAHDYRHHNGPGCSVCSWSCCWHCSTIDKIPMCDAIPKRNYWKNNWLTNRDFEKVGYRKFTKENKLRIINEWRKLYNKPELTL